MFQVKKSLFAFFLKDWKGSVFDTSTTEKLNVHNFIQRYGTKEMEAKIPFANIQVLHQLDAIHYGVVLRASGKRWN